MMKRYIIGILILWMAVTAGAQPIPVDSCLLSLDSCKALALRNNLEIKNAALEVEAAQEVKKQAFTKYFPNVSAMAGGYYAAKPLIEYGIDDIGNAQARQWLHNLYFEYGAAMGLPDKISLCENGVMTGAMVVQPVYMGGQIVNGNRLAKVGVKAAELQGQLTEDRILQQVEEYYWLIISLQEKQKTLEQAMIFIDTLQRDVNAAVEAGLVSKNDQLKVSVKRNEIYANLLKVQNGLHLASDALGLTIGIYSGKWVLTDTIGDISKWMVQWKDPWGSAYTRKETQLLHLQVNAEELKKKMSIGETLPHLTVGGTASYGNLVFDRFTANALAFTTLKVPLTDWWEASHKMKQHDIQIQKAKNELVDYGHKMYLEIMQAWYNLDDAGKQFEIAKLSLQDAEANLLDVKANYEAGLIPVSELLEAQTLFLQAQNQRTDALIDLKIKAERYKMLTRNMIEY